MATQRESLLNETFVTLADTMVSDFDVVDFLSMLSSRCVELFGAGEAGLMLGNGDEHLELAASSSHEMRLLELLEIQHDEGPCPEAYRTASAVSCTDLRDATDKCQPSPHTRSMPASVQRTHCRCGCVTTSSVRSTSCSQNLTRFPQVTWRQRKHSRTSPRSDCSTSVR